MVVIAIFRVIKAPFIDGNLSIIDCYAEAVHVFRNFVHVIKNRLVGAPVHVIEKTVHVHENCCSRVLRILSAFNTTDHKRQPKQGIKDSPELHAEQTLKGGDFRANPALVHKMTENSEAALNWLEEMGVAFKPEVYQVYGALYPRSHDAVHSLGSDYIKVLKAQCDKLGIKIFTNSRVTGLIREQPLSGRVLGVEFEDSKKAKKYWKADIVVVCAGGFGANPKMRAKYDPRMLNLTTTNHVGATGDLIPLMEDIGADVIGMDHIQCNPGCPPGRKQRIVLHMHVEHLVMVDRKGQRFVAEEIRRSLQSQIPERKEALQNPHL